MNNNIEEDYCSFEVSKLLNEKGFSFIDRCDNRGYNLDETFILLSAQDLNVRIGYILAPTHALAIKWLRVNFNIHIVVYHTKSNLFNANVHKQDERLKFIGTEKSYEQATEAALLYTLQNLIP